MRSKSVSDQPNIPKITDETAKLAFRFWEEEGQPEGKAVAHWLRAEQMVRVLEKPLRDGKPHQRGCEDERTF